MTKKVYDCAVKVGEYTDAEGGVKGRYENVGVVLEGDNGMFMLLKRTFNPAGVDTTREGDDKVAISFFEPRDDEKKITKPAAKSSSSRGSKSSR